MRHWIVYWCFIVESWSVKNRAGFLKDVTKPVHSLPLHSYPWRIVNSDCSWQNLLGKNIFKPLAMWRDSFSTGGLGLLGCKPSSHEEERGKEPILGREAKRSKWAIVQSNEEKLKRIWIWSAMSQMQQLKQLSPGTMILKHKNPQLIFQQQ